MMPVARVLFSEMALRVGTLNSGNGVRSCIAAERFPSLSTDVLGNQYVGLNAVAKKFVMNVWNTVSGLGRNVAFINIAPSSAVNSAVIGDTIGDTP